MKLLEQPEFPGFQLEHSNGETNVDPMTQCLYRGIYNQLQHPELGIQYGMVLVWDEKIKHYDPFWSYHVWNVNEDETIIYDNFELVQKGVDDFKYQLKNPIKDWKVKVIDGSNLKAKSHYLKSFDVIDKVTKPYKGQYDVIYLQNFGFRPNGYTQITWDMFEKDCDDIENLLTSGQTKEVPLSNNTIEIIDGGKMSIKELFVQADRSGADSLLTPDFEFYIKQNSKWIKQDMGDEFEELKLELQK
jgi:hypothetical protein